VTSLVRVPHRQHTVSKVVLRKFGRNGVMTVYDRKNNVITCKGPNGAFIVENFEGIRPVETEERWNGVETKMDRVYDLIRTRKVLEDADAVATLIDFMAVHWSRSPGIRAAHDRIANQLVQTSRRRYEHEDRILSHAFTRRTGLVASTRGELEWINNELHNVIAFTQREQWWSDRIGINFEEARKLFAHSAIQVGYAHGADFIIGDVPVITRKEGHDGLGPHQGVAIGDSAEIVMPIAPDVIIGLGAEAKYLELARGDVERYNGFQIRAFDRWLAAQPLGESDQAMRKHLPARRIYPFKPQRSGRR
jgi:hypothetical protein